jgi:hypothetical protein
MAVILSDLVNVLATPTDVFLRLKKEPRWVAAFVVVALMLITIALFTAPFSNHVLGQVLAQKLEKEQLDRALAMSSRFQYIGLVFVPVVTLVRWVFITALLYFAAIFLGAPQVTFRSLFVCVLYAEVIMVLMGTMNVLLLYIKGMDGVRTIVDLQAIIGFDYFLRDRTSNLPLFLFLNNINVFNIWYVATIGIGVSVVTCFHKFKSMILVTFVFLLGVGFQVVLTALTSNSAIGKGI